MTTNFFQAQEGAEIIDRMIEMTEQGRLPWSAEQGNDQFFWANMPRFAVAIMSRDGDDAHPFVLRLESKLTRSTIAEYETDPQSDPETIRRIQNLFWAAKRQVYRLDTLYEDLSEDLDAVTRPREEYGPDEAPF